MNRQAILFLLLFLILITPVSATIWRANTSVVSGLPAPINQHYAAPAYFNAGGSQNLLVMLKTSGTYYGYTWGGTSWSSNSSVSNGIPNLGTTSLTTPTIFNNGKTELIIGEMNGNFYGYDWNTTAPAGWKANTTLVTNLPGGTYTYPAPDVWQWNGQWSLAFGEYFGSIYGYTWTCCAAQWTPNSSVVVGIPSVATMPVPEVFYKDGKWQMIIGKLDGTFSGYSFSSGQWASDSSVITGLTTNGNRASPNVVQFNGLWTMFNGVDTAGGGQIFGYTEDQVPTVPVQTTHSNYHASASTTVAWSASTDGDGESITYDVKVGTTSGGTNVINQVGDGKTGSTSSTSSNSFTMTPTNTYYWSVRACDTNTCSAWSGEQSFAFTNTAPSMTSNVVTPSIPSTTDTLTDTPSATDANGDSITYAYQWYKDGSQIGGATSSTLAPPLVAASKYKVFVTPSDTWASGTGTYSNEVTVKAVPPAPVSIASTTGNFWVNTTWAAGTGVVTDSYNVSVNGVWTNGTTNTYANSTLSAHASQNVIVYAYNNSAGGTLSTSAATKNTQIPNNQPSVSNVASSYSLVEGQTLSINVQCSDLDGDTCTFTRSFSKGSFDSNTGILTWNTGLGDAGTYSWSFTANDSYINSVPYTFTVQVNGSTPLQPVLFFDTTGNFWVNYTWQPGSNTDTFNVSQNSTWTNGTIVTFKNNTVGAHGWSNITVCGYNNTVHVLGSCVAQNTQIPNNPVVLSNISDTYTSGVGQLLGIYPISTDLDLDPPTFATNANKGTFYSNNGTLKWTPQGGDSGTYNWYINVTDGNGSTATKSFGVSVESTVPGQPLNLTAITGNFFVNYTWSPSVNTNTFNTSFNGVWTNGTTTRFINNSVGAHGWGNITVLGYNDTSQVLGAAATSNTQVPNNVPVFGTGTLSASPIYTTGSTIISIPITDADNDALTVTAGITLVGGVEVNYTMTATGGSSTYNYTFSTLTTGTYTIIFYADDGYHPVVSSQTLTISVTNPVGGGSGGGGGYVSPTPVPSNDSVANVSKIFDEFNFVNVTDTRSAADLEKIGKCLSQDFMLSSACSGGTINIVKDPMNYWVLVGAYLFSFIMIFLSALIDDKPRAYFTDTLLYGTFAVIFVMLFSLVGLNMFVFNFVFQSSLPGYMFGSFGVWAAFITIAGDQYSYGEKKNNRTHSVTELAGNVHNAIEDNYAIRQWNKFAKGK